MSVPFQRAGWIADSNIYEVNVRQYTPEGSFNAFSRELPRLKDMGIDILWFMPITPISVEKRKGSLGSYYACSDYLSINPEFGSLEDFKQLVGKAHEMGMRVIIDWVANHTGWDHHWTREHPDYYRKNHEGQFFEAHGWEDVIDLNYDNPELRRAMIEAMSWWLRECNIDGYRCDMAMLVPLDFWREARMELDKQKKDLFWLAECEEVAYHEVFDATYTWKLLHKMEAVWRKEAGVDGLDEVLSYYNAMFPPEAIRVYFTSNHDENSHSGSEYERMGNAARAFAVLCATWNGMPMIYSGQELPNHKRLQFFERDPIAWTGQYELHVFYKTLLECRKRNPALRGGDPAAATRRISTGEHWRCFGFVRSMGVHEVLVLLNISGDSLVVPAGDLQLTGIFREIFTGVEMDVASVGRIELEPWGYRVFEKNPSQ
ncbi:MAG: 1,4-alpha-glucan branching protein [Chitinophagaceae bacterium]|nr:1,4-alpha-glucan branching protein [Chitinophagaceae bacterium]